MRKLLGCCERAAFESAVRMGKGSPGGRNSMSRVQRVWDLGGWGGGPWAGSQDSVRTSVHRGAHSWESRKQEWVVDFIV